MVSAELLASAVVNGLVTGTVLVLLSIGLSLIFGLMRVVNFAHGVFYMIGAYVAASLVGIIGFFPALVVAAVVVAIVGTVTEYVIIRPLYDRDHVLQILVTFGLTLFITEAVKQLAIAFTGNSSMTMNIPGYFQGTYLIGPATMTYYNTFLIALGAVLAALVWFLLARTNIGSIIRGGTYDAEIIQVMGVDIQRYWTGLFAFGSALAGVAGGLAAPVRPILPTMGIDILLIVFVVVIVGGLGSYLGSVIAGLLIGQVMAITAVFWSQGTNVLVFAVLIVVLLIRPEGIMGEPEVLE